MTTTAFASFVLFQFAMLTGLIRNAYVGLIVYLGFPLLFVLGLLLIPIAWYRQRRRTGPEHERVARATIRRRQDRR